MKKLFSWLPLSSLSETFPKKIKEMPAIDFSTDAVQDPKS